MDISHTVVVVLRITSSIKEYSKAKQNKLGREVIFPILSRRLFEKNHSTYGVYRDDHALLRNESRIMCFASHRLVLTLHIYGSLEL